MIDSIRNPLTSAFRKTLLFIGAVNVPLDPDTFEKLSSNGTDVERYIQNLVNGYNAHGSARMQDYRVEEMYLCRERTSVGNTYLSAKVIGPDPTTPFYIIFERVHVYIDFDRHTTSSGPSDAAEVHEQAAIAQVRNTAHAGWDHVIRPGRVIHRSSSCMQGRGVDDRAFISFTRKTHEIQRTIIFQHPIPIYTVAVVAVTVHRSRVEHDTASASCYFYAATIMAVLEQLYSANISHQNISRATWANVGRVPTFSNAPVPAIDSSTKILPEVLQLIVASYKVDVENFENQAQFKDKQDQLEQEIIRADREAARADREAKRATEAEAEHARLLEELAAAKRHVSVAVLGL